MRNELERIREEIHQAIARLNAELDKAARAGQTEHVIVLSTQITALTHDLVKVMKMEYGADV